MVANSYGNMLIVAFGILIVFFFIAVAFILLSQEAEQFAISSKDRISTNFAAFSGLHVAIAKLSDELIKEGQFTKNSKLFFKGEDNNWNFQYREENDLNDNDLVDTFNIPLELAKNVSIEKNITTSGNKILLFRVKIVDESAKLPINDDVKLTSKILRNLSQCLGLDLDISKFMDARVEGMKMDERSLVEIFGEKYGKFLTQFFTFYPKAISKTVYYTDSIRYDGENIYSIMQMVPNKESIKMGLKPFLNINTATKPLVCANLLNLDAFYLMYNRVKDVSQTYEDNDKVVRNIDDMSNLGVVKYISLEQNDFNIFYENFVQHTKERLFRTYKEFFNFLFSKSGIDTRKAELIWVNANPNIDIVKFNDIWNYMYVKRNGIGQLIHKTIDKLDLVLPTYEFSFNSSGLFSVEVEGRYQYRKIILARDKITALVDLMDYIIDTTQQDFLAGTIEFAKTPTKNGYALITYPEYKFEQAKNNDIDGQIGLSYNTNSKNALCSIEYGDEIAINIKKEKKLKVTGRFLPTIKKYYSIFDIYKSPSFTPSGALIDGIKTLTIPVNFCFNSFEVKLPSYISHIGYFNESQYYDALHLGFSAWVKPSYFSIFSFPFISFFSDRDELTSFIYKLYEDDLFRLITREFKIPIIFTPHKKFFGCIENSDIENFFSANKWFHVGINIELKSCIDYYVNLPKDPKNIDSRIIKWFLLRCPYYTFYVNGVEIDRKNEVFKHLLQFNSSQFIDSKDLSNYSKLVIGDTKGTNTFFTIDNINFFDKYGLLKDIIEATNKGRYYNHDAKFSSRAFSNKDDYRFLLSSEVLMLLADEKYNNILCIKFSDVTGVTDCYGNLIDYPYARWNVSFVGKTFNYHIHWKSISSCGNNISPIIDSVILTMLKKADIKFVTGN